MPKYYIQIILSLIGLIFALTFLYFKYTEPSSIIEFDDLHYETTYRTPTYQINACQDYDVFCTSLLLSSRYILTRNV